MGKFLALAILICAAIAGGALYYLQVYAYYDRLPATGPQDVMAVPAGAEDPVALPHTGFEAIDSASSPIRYRACFRVTDAFDPADWTAYAGAEPRVAPGWFDCFDADEIGDAVSGGTATALLSVPNVHYGIDRVIAVLPDGRGYAWHQINRCGEVVFDGRPTPPDCPTPPEGTARQ